MRSDVEKGSVRGREEIGVGIKVVLRILQVGDFPAGRFAETCFEWGVKEGKGCSRTRTSWI